MALRELEFTSHNGTDTIQAWVYEPAVTPVAVVQLIHGLGEHSRRYLHMTAALVDAGFVVVADDHAGHGRTAMQSGTWGDAGDESATVIVQDEVTLYRKAKELFPDLPYVVFGHSLGSMIARALVLQPGVEVDGLALGGIAVGMRGVESTLDREALKAAVAADGSAPAADALVGQLFDGFYDRLGPDFGPTDWVARNADVVRDHGRDPFNNFGAPLSNRFLQGFVDVYDQANGDDFFDRLPQVPVAIFAGEGESFAKLPGPHAGRQHRRGKARAFFVGPVDQHDRRLGLDAGLVERPHHLQARQHAQHAVELAAGRLGVEMRADIDRQRLGVRPLAAGEHRADHAAAQRAAPALRPKPRAEAAHVAA